MNVSIITTQNFRREAKKLLKKYRSLKNELTQFQEDLGKNPNMGTLITENVYKIRLGVKSKGRGKSGGLRIITYIHILEKENGEIDIYLLSIYDKSDYENISDGFLKEIVEEIQNEIADAQQDTDDIDKKLNADEDSEKQKDNNNDE